MAYKNEKGEIVTQRGVKKSTKKTNIKDNTGRSFYFLWPTSEGCALYVWYVIEDMWDKVRVWLLKQSTKDHCECTLRESILTYDNKIDYKHERIQFYSTPKDSSRKENKEG